MANKLFESLRSGQSPQVATPNIPDFWGQVSQMQRTIANPRAEVEKLLESGQMTKEQFEQMGRVASQMLGAVPK